MGTTADKLARLNETKALLKTRLTEKGLDVASEDNFYNLANKVGEIQASNQTCKVSISQSLGAEIPFYYMNDNGEPTYSSSSGDKIVLSNTIAVVVDNNSMYDIDISGNYYELGSYGSVYFIIFTGDCSIAHRVAGGGN